MGMKNKSVKKKLDQTTDKNQVKNPNKKTKT